MSAGCGRGSVADTDRDADAGSCTKLSKEWIHEDCSLLSVSSIEGNQCHRYGYARVSRNLHLKSEIRRTE